MTVPFVGRFVRRTTLARTNSVMYFHIVQCVHVPKRGAEFSKLKITCMYVCCTQCPVFLNKYDVA